MLLPSAQVKYINDLMLADLLYWRDLWFRWLLLSTKLVVAGLVLERPELIYEIISIRGRVRIEKSSASLQESHTPDWVKIVALLGWLFIVAGVAGEWITDAVISEADSNIQAFNNALLAETTKEAGDARASAELAASEAERATSESGKATVSALNALALAKGARQEADSFEQGIVSAKKQAAEAESHLAEALRQAAKATEELNRLKTPRSLTRVAELITALEPFKGTEYVFVSVFQDEESIYLVRAIDGVLQKAGWKRGKSVGGFPAINIYGKDKTDFSVPVGFNIGVQISADSPTPINESLQIRDQPQYLQAAATLNVGLSQFLSPPQDNSVGKMVGVETGGTSTTIRIAVGRKP